MNCKKYVCIRNCIKYLERKIRRQRNIKFFFCIMLSFKWEEKLVTDDVSNGKNVGKRFYIFSFSLANWHNLMINAWASTLLWKCSHLNFMLWQLQWLCQCFLFGLAITEKIILTRFDVDWRIPLRFGSSNSSSNSMLFH